MRFVVCPDCGNKRCPKSNDHRNACTGSNEVGQNGSSWEHVKPLAQPEQEPWPEEPFGHMAGGVQPPQAEVLAQAVPDETLTIVYQSGYYDGKKAALAGLERNFCERCGKRTADLTVIHTCTPPQD
jgi:hypothetical protein